MLVLIVVLLALIPAIAIIYPFLRGLGRGEPEEDESSVRAERARRWDMALAGLKSVELEWSIGNLSDEDYLWMKEQYINEATLALKAMDLEEDMEQELLASIELEAGQARAQASGEDGFAPDAPCPRCAIPVRWDSGKCTNCGQVLAAIERESAPDPGPTGEAVDE